MLTQPKYRLSPHIHQYNEAVFKVAIKYNELTSLPCISIGTSYGTILGGSEKMVVHHFLCLVIESKG